MKLQGLGQEGLFTKHYKRVSKAHTNENWKNSPELQSRCKHFFVHIILINLKHIVYNENLISFQQKHIWKYHIQACHIGWLLIIFQ